MSISLLLVQILNGLQLGILLYLTADGVTLVLSIINCISLAHVSF
jgi:branched-chain amino acid transport system permease protein